MKNKKLLSLVAILFTLASFIILTYLSVKHYDLKSGTSAAASVCNISEKFNCDAVSASSYSEFLSIPVAVWGAAAQAALLLLLLIYHFAGSINAIRMSFVIGLINIVAVAVMGSITVMFLNTYCLFCLLSYVTLLVSFICICKLQEGFHFASTLKDKVYLAFLIAVPVAAYMTNDIALGESYKNLEKGMQFYLLQWTNSPEKQIPAIEAVSYGASSENAKMTIVEFADFNCIHCKHAAPVLHSFVKAHADTRLVFYHFPLDGGCNPSIPNPGVSCDMAKAVFCGHKLSPASGWAAHQAMFETEKPQSLDQAVDIVTSNTKVVKDNLVTCMNSPETLTAIQTQAKLGTELGVKGTPTIFVNNKLLQGGNMLPVLKEAYKTLK